MLQKIIIWLPPCPVYHTIESRMVLPETPFVFGRQPLLEFDFPHQSWQAGKSSTLKSYKLCTCDIDECVTPSPPPPPELGPSADDQHTCGAFEMLPYLGRSIT
jgi:hypothetical protein